MLHVTDSSWTFEILAVILLCREPQYSCFSVVIWVYKFVMGPKKAPAGKKKEGNPENGGELTAEEKAKLFMLTCQSLQVQLCKCRSLLSIGQLVDWSIIIHIFAAERSEEASKALAAKREYKGRIEQIQRDFEEEQKQTFEITQDMTRQYKGMQEELLTRVWRFVSFHGCHGDWQPLLLSITRQINKLEDTIQDLNDRLGSYLLFSLFKFIIWLTVHALLFKNATCSWGRCASGASDEGQEPHHRHEGTNSFFTPHLCPIFDHALQSSPSRICMAPFVSHRCIFCSFFFVRRTRRSMTWSPKWTRWPRSSAKCSGYVQHRQVLVVFQKGNVF